MAGPQKTGIRFGLNKGHVTTKREMRPRAVLSKGKKTARVGLVREIVREVAGFAPYEKRVMELIKMGSAASFKRALKYSKARLGTHRRGQRKRAEMQAIIQEARKKH